MEDTPEINQPEPKKKFSAKVLLILLLFLAVFAAGVAGGVYWFGLKNKSAYQPKNVCIQVITEAKNPETGEVREFPTPCDIPQGWEPVNN